MKHRMIAAVSLLVALPSAAACGQVVADGQAPSSPPVRVAPGASALPPVPDAPDAGGVACGNGSFACKSTCVDLRTDAANCGACGHGCGDGTCTAGLCSSTLVAAEPTGILSMTADDASVYWSNGEHLAVAINHGGQHVRKIAYDEGGIGKLSTTGDGVVYMVTAKGLARAQADGSMKTVELVKTSKIIVGIGADAMGAFWVDRSGDADAIVFTSADGRISAKVMTPGPYLEGFAQDDARVFVADELGNIRSYARPGPTATMTTGTVIVQALVRRGTFAAHRHRLYWVDATTNALVSIPPAGGDPEVLSATVGKATGLALDDASAYVVLSSENGDSYVDRIDLERRTSVPLFQSKSQIDALAVKHGFAYIANFAAGTIVKVPK